MSSSNCCFLICTQLHGPPGPPALPLLKASFPPFGSQYCHAPLGRQHSAVSPGVAHGPAAAAALYQTSYSLPDPRQFHCISVGTKCRPNRVFASEDNPSA